MYAKVGVSAEPRSKSAVFGTIAQHVGIHRRDVAAAFHVMGSIIKADLSKSGSGVFKVPGLMRITVKRKPATKQRQGINPFTKEPTVFKAKPARTLERVGRLRRLAVDPLPACRRQARSCRKWAGPRVFPAAVWAGVYAERGRLAPIRLRHLPPLSRPTPPLSLSRETASSTFQTA